MKKGNRKILLGLLAVFLLLVGLYVYHVNSLREGGGFGVAHERSELAKDLRIDGEIYSKMMDVHPDWRLDGVVNGVEAEWKVYSNFDFQKTKANWEKTEGALLDSNGRPVKYNDPTTNSIPEETHLFFMDKEMIAAQTEYEKTNVLTNEGFIRVNELKTIYPEIPPKVLFDILKVEEMRGSTMSAENLSGLNELAKVQPKLVAEILRIEINELETNEPETNESGANSEIMDTLLEKQSEWSLEDWKTQTNFDMEKTLENWNPETKIIFDSNGMPAKYNDKTMGNKAGGGENLINTPKEILEKLRIERGIPQAELEQMERMWARQSAGPSEWHRVEGNLTLEDKFPAHETNSGSTGELSPPWDVHGETHPVEIHDL